MRPFLTKEGLLESALREGLNKHVGGLGKVGQFKLPWPKERWQEKVSRQRFRNQYEAIPYKRGLVRKRFERGAEQACRRAGESWPIQVALAQRALAGKSFPPPLEEIDAMRCLWAISARSSLLTSPLFEATMVLQEHFYHLLNQHRGRHAEHAIATGVMRRMWSTGRRGRGQISLGELLASSTLCCCAPRA